MDNSKIYLYGKEVVTPYYLNEAVADKASKQYVDNTVAEALAETPSIDLSNYYTKEEIDALIGDINTILAELVEGKVVSEEE